MKTQIELYSLAINIVDVINSNNQLMANELFGELKNILNIESELKAYDKEGNLVTINQYSNGHIVYTDRSTIASSEPAVFIELSRNGDAISFEHYTIDSHTGKRQDV